jgi:D-sedoheptulose 7-phosphate isomerase
LHKRRAAATTAGRWKDHAQGIDMADPKAVQRHFSGSRDLLDRVTNDPDFLAEVGNIAERVARILREGGKLLIAGNGGSAADAQHVAAEFLSRFGFDRHPLPAIALTTDTSVLTAIGNDYGFERVFERQVRGLGRKGDAFLAISTSGRSANILAALHAAREIGVTTIGFSGAAGDMHALCDLFLAVPSKETALIQQIHITAFHAICGIVEHELFAGSESPKG